MKMSGAKSVYDIIKRQNGEAFAKAIRRFDNGLFEIENLPQIVQYAGRNLLPLLTYLEYLKNEEQKCYVADTLDPFVLLKRAGYNAFYADSLEKQNSILPYFAKGEVLCTFRDEARYQKYHIIHAIKEGADTLNREDFLGKEKREDEYGTSVISIQILKEGGFIKITNRYNHTVAGSDNTFNSNPDAIIRGLSTALQDYFGITFQSDLPEFEKDFILCNDRIYKYHAERDNIYFGNGYFIKDARPYFINPDYQMIVDSFILDFKENKIITNYNLSPAFFPDDVVLDLIQKEIQGKRLTRKKSGNQTLVYANNRLILKVRDAQMIYLNLKDLGPCLEINNPIFTHHDTIEEVYLDTITKLSCYSFNDCPNLKKVSMNALIKMENDCFVRNPRQEVALLKSIISMGENCFRCCGFKALEYEKLEYFGEGCFCELPFVEDILLVSAKEDGSHSFRDNPNLKRLISPYVRLKFLKDTVCPNEPYFAVNNMPFLEKIVCNNGQCFKKVDCLKRVLGSKKTNERAS